MSEDNVPKDAAKWPDGKPVLVVRPPNPKKTLALALVAVRHQSEEAYEATAEDGGTFVGYLVRRRGKTLAATTNHVEEVQSGDLFVHPDNAELAASA